MKIKKSLLPSKYLGIPLFQGVNKPMLWKNLVDNCLKCLDSWKGRWLTYAGRILLLQSVILAIPIFFMSYLKIPIKVLRYIEQRMRKFLWNGVQEEDKIPLVAWDQLCKPKKYGGVGIRKLQIVNEVLGAKLIWDMYDNPAQLWVQILRAKYLDLDVSKHIFTI